MFVRSGFLLVTILAASGCRRTPPGPLTLTVGTFEQRPDGGPGAVSVAEKHTSDAAQVAIVTDAMRTAAASGPLRRCTFLEGGDPVGLQFVLSDRRRVYLRGTLATAMLADGCYEVPAGSIASLRALARTLGARDPALAP